MEDFLFDCENENDFGSFDDFADDVDQDEADEERYADDILERQEMEDYEQSDEYFNHYGEYDFDSDLGGEC